ncbi:MAG: HAD family hydrolase [Brevefilum sp.]
MTTNIEAVIFDLDGLMIESEQFNFDVITRVLEKHGKQVNQAWFEPTIGMDNLETAEFLINETGLHLTPEEFIEEKHDLMLRVLPEVTKPNPGLMDVLQDLIDAELKMGVASNSFRVYVRTALETLGVYESFGCVVSADDVEHTKPAPDIYLLAAERLGVQPEKCLALEDSPLGMQAALKAGMACVAIPNPHLKGEDFGGATFVFSSLVAFRQNMPRILNNGRL